MLHAHDPQRIDAIVPRVLQRTEQHHGALVEIQGAWRALVGRALAAHTKPVSLRKGRLVVHADRPGDTFALSYQREQVLQRLRVLSRGRVEELVVRTSESARP